MEATMMLLDCPAYLDHEGSVRCGLPAEVRCQFTMRSSDGPLESAMIRTAGAGRSNALQEAGAQVHLAHPLGVKAFEYRRVKNDVRDATDLADLLRSSRLAEAWIVPPPVRELREL